MGAVYIATGGMKSPSTDGALVRQTVMNRHVHMHVLKCSVSKRGAQIDLRCDTYPRLKIL